MHYNKLMNKKDLLEYLEEKKEYLDIMRKYKRPVELCLQYPRAYKRGGASFT